MSNTGGDEEMPEATSSSAANEDSKPQQSNDTKSTGSNKDYKSSAQLCEEMGIVNIEYSYTPDDFANLVTYKLFNQHIRPLLLEKNPKLVMYKMVSVIGAKWREFIELKEKQQQQPSGSASPATGGEEDKKPAVKEEAPADEPAKAGASSRRQTTRRRTGTQQEAEDAAESAAAAAAAAIAEQADLEDQTTRRSSRNKRVIVKSCIHNKTIIYL